MFINYSQGLRQIKIKFSANIVLQIVDVHSVYIFEPKPPNEDKNWWEMPTRFRFNATFKESITAETYNEFISEPRYYYDFYIKL